MTVKTNQYSIITLLPSHSHWLIHNNTDKKFYEKTIACFMPISYELFTIIDIKCSHNFNYLYKTILKDKLLCYKCFNIIEIVINKQTVD